MSISVVYIKELLGHVSIAITEAHVRADTEQKGKALESAYGKRLSNNTNVG